MIDTLSSPPRWAHALLQSLLRPSDSESIPGDLLEEYRDVRRPSLGALRANAWYVTHVLSVLWHVMWPCAVPMAALKLLSVTLSLSWNPSLVQAPGVSLLDALTFLWAGYYGSQRTRLVRTGIVTAGTTSFLGFAMMAVYAAIKMPSLVLAPFEKPFIFAIMFILLAIALGFGIVVGAVGAAVGRWLPPTAWNARVS